MAPTCVATQRANVTASVGRGEQEARVARHAVLQHVGAHGRAGRRARRPCRAAARPTARPRSAQVDVQLFDLACRPRSGPRHSSRRYCASSTRSGPTTDTGSTTCAVSDSSMPANSAGGPRPSKTKSCAESHCGKPRTRSCRSAICSGRLRCGQVCTAAAVQASARRRPQIRVSRHPKQSGSETAKVVLARGGVGAAARRRSLQRRSGSGGPGGSSARSSG